MSVKQDDCVECQEQPFFHAALHAGHIWTNMNCPAYLTLDGDDCTCSESAS